MTELKLNDNQAALILEVSEDGEVNVDIAINSNGDNDNNNFAAAICQTIAIKLVKDEKFKLKYYHL